MEMGNCPNYIPGLALSTIGILSSSKNCEVKQVTHFTNEKTDAQSVEMSTTESSSFLSQTPFFIPLCCGNQEDLAIDSRTLHGGVDFSTLKIKARKKLYLDVRQVFTLHS